MRTLRNVATLVLMVAACWPAAAQDQAREAAPAADAPKAQAGPARKPEKLELGKTTITGNRELPKVMYVVPWKQTQAGDLKGRPMRSLVDEVLAPVDREVFNREIDYFRTLETAREAGGETPVTASQAAP